MILIVPPNDSNDEIRVEHQYDENTPPSIAIVEAISAIEDVDPMNFQTSLGMRLYDQIDPEALDRLVTDDEDGSTVNIDLTLDDGNEYAVQIHNDGRLVVQKAV